MVDPNQPGHYPVCPLLHATGIACPGCGGLRTVHALAHGDLVTAAGRNALVLVAAVLAAGLWVRWVGRAVRGRPADVPFRAVHGWLAGALTVAFTVARNLPAGAGLGP